RSRSLSMISSKCDVECAHLAVVYFFFFQAEDGIRDRNVTGVQTCALPIFIPLAGTSVKIRNADTGEWVVQHINYPSPMDIDTFVTDSTGTLMLPETLGFGNYELYEQQSPWGYVLDDEPVPFVVDGTQDVVTVTKYNTVQKGTITVHKEGEVFSHVAEAGGLYQPQYEVQGQPGAVYDITALEDIVTPDG